MRTTLTALAGLLVLASSASAQAAPRLVITPATRSVVAGDSVQFGASNLLATFRRKVGAAKNISRQEANTFIAEYVAGLEGYTYLEGEAAR